MPSSKIVKAFVPCAFWTLPSSILWTLSSDSAKFEKFKNLLNDLATTRDSWDFNFLIFDISCRNFFVSFSFIFFLVFFPLLALDTDLISSILFYNVIPSCSLITEPNIFPSKLTIFDSSIFAFLLWLYFFAI